MDLTITWAIISALMWGASIIVAYRIGRNAGIVESVNEEREFLARRVRHPIGEELEWARKEAKRLNLP